MRKKKGLSKCGENIIGALLKLKTPIIGKGGKHFVVRDESRYESGIEHIANKRHRLKVRDIKSISEILKHPKIEMVDPNNKNYRNYYGVRKEKNNGMLLKIVTLPYKEHYNSELIVTIFPTKAIKFERKKK